MADLQWLGRSRPKWGIAFALDHRAFQLWKKSGNQVAFQSPWVGTISLNVNDKDNQLLSLAITHAYAPQQSASAEDSVDK
jgi:hypothetical protein